MMVAQELTEAQRVDAQHQSLVALVILLAVVLGGGLVIMLVRRKLYAPKGGSDTEGGFSLSELRAMRDRGDITPAEYEATRAHVIAKVKAAADKPKTEKPPPLDAEDAAG